MKKVIIYTDGACSGNPGPGGYGAILMYGNHIKKIYGGEDNTTNNRMELRGPIEALKLLTEKCQVEIYSDSSYVVKMFNEGWIYGWEKKNYAGKANVDMVKELLSLVRQHEVKWVWVKGHAENPHNNECDTLATSYAAMIKNKTAPQTDGSAIEYKENQE